mgnify:CR=1 FL=1
MISANLSAIFYLVSGVLFILALRGLSSPETSRQGNLFGILGMTIAIVVTFLSIGNFSTGFIYVLIFILVGGSIGAFIAYRIPMTAMPELVAGFHSLVGLAAVFVAVSYTALESLSGKSSTQICRDCSLSLRFKKVVLSRSLDKPGGMT